MLVARTSPMKIKQVSSLHTPFSFYSIEHIYSPFYYIHSESTHMIVLSSPSFLHCYTVTNSIGYYPGTNQFHMNHDDDFGIFVPPRVPYSTPLRDTCSQTYKALRTCMNGFNTALYNGIMLGVSAFVDLSITL